MKRSLPVPGHPPRLTPKTGRPSKALKGLAVHDCTYKGCGKTYTRKEHLLRHERTHRNELPYVCIDCGQGYARQDLLKRHSTLKHGHSHPNVPESARSNGINGGSTPPQLPQSITDLRGYRPIEQNGQQQILPKSQLNRTPTRQASTTTQDLDPFSRMQISQSQGNRNQYGIANARVEPSTVQLPVPWGAQRFANEQEDVDVDLLRAASYGDLTEVRRLHLVGVDVLASGKFENGGPKSALFAAADAIRTAFEDIQRNYPQPGPERDKLWRDIHIKTEIIKYLVFHGALVDKLDPVLKSNVQRALQGPPAIGAMEQQMQAAGGYRLIAAASPDVKLAPMLKSEEKSRRESLSTAALCRVKTGDAEIPKDQQEQQEQQSPTE